MGLTEELFFLFSIMCGELAFLPLFQNLFKVVRCSVAGGNETFYNSVYYTSVNTLCKSVNCVRSVNTVSDPL